jgi:hypothetical protein
VSFGNALTNVLGHAEAERSFDLARFELFAERLNRRILSFVVRMVPVRTISGIALLMVSPMPAYSVRSALSRTSSVASGSPAGS